MAVCIYESQYGKVARKVVGKTLVNAFLCGFHSPVTRRAFNDGKKRLDEMEMYGKHVLTERNLLWKSAVNYFGREIESAQGFIDCYRT